MLSRLNKALSVTPVTTIACHWCHGSKYIPRDIIPLYVTPVTGVTVLIYMKG